MVNLHRCHWQRAQKVETQIVSPQGNTRNPICLSYSYFMYICGYDFILKYFRINLIYSKIQKI